MPEGIGQLLINLFLIFGSLILVTVVTIFVLKNVLSRRGRLPGTFQKVTLLVTVPKERVKKESKTEEPKTAIEQIAQVEAMFANLGGVKSQRGSRSFFYGRQDHFALEIVADKEGLISFYITVPHYMQDFIEKQIHAQYPEAQIEPTEDYNIFTPKGAIAGAYLTLRKKYIFPIQTYQKLNADPLNALTNILSKLDEKKEGAVIQYILRSAHPGWHSLGAKVASQMQQGKNLKQAMSKSGSGNFFRTIGSGIFEQVFSSSKKDDYLKPEKIYTLSPMEQEIVKGLEEKTNKAGFDVNIRIVASAETEARAQEILKNIADSFSQYTAYEYGNGFVRSGVISQKKLIHDFIYRNFNDKKKCVLNAEEMISLYHLPLETTETPNIRWLLAQKAPAPTRVPREGIILGRNLYRGEETIIKLKRDDRRRHVYIIGKSGTGKSVLLSNMVIQDIQNGEGVCVVDPHGDLVEDILESVPKERVEDVIIFNPADMERPMGLNMLEAKSEDEKDFAVQEMIAIFYKLFPPEMIGPMFEHNMRNVMLTLMSDPENPGTIAEIPRMFTDQEYQKYWISKLEDPVVKNFWEKEMAQTSDFHKSEMLGYLISKVGRFVENVMLRNIIGQSHSGFDIDDIIKNKKILLINLSKGKVGEVNSSLLGLIIVSKLQMAALAQGSLPEEERRDFYLYIDEFQNYTTDSIATILSEARKYRLNLIMAHQYMGQLVKEGGDSTIRDAVLGNAGTIISFKIGVEDAEILAKEFTPVFNEYDVVNVEKFTAYVRLLIDNQASRAFNMHTYPPLPGNQELAQKIKELSRLKYGRPRKEVEAEIMERSRLGETTAAPGPATGERNM